MITASVVWALGASQLLCWGTSFYVIALYAEPITSETGWSLPLVHGGFSAALVVMGLASPAVGRAIDRIGGRPVMIIGSCLLAAACLTLSDARSLSQYYAAWLIFGLAMRMTLYDAAFAALARVDGQQAKRPISQITLLGGLASTVLWPVGRCLIGSLGWRHALWVYAGLAFATVPLHCLIPARRYDHGPLRPVSATMPLADTPARRRLAAVLFATGLTCTTCLASAFSAHMISLLSSLGFASAVWVSSLRGVGQSGARLCEIVFGRYLDPLLLGVIAAGLTMIGVVFAFWGGVTIEAALVFSLCFGAGNGLATIVRGTQPLVLFDPASYGALTGWLITPSFFISAAAPTVFALLGELYGSAAAIIFTMFCALGALVSAVALWVNFQVIVSRA